jgi:outer membrane biosynthesis protein TonB
MKQTDKRQAPMQTSATDAEDNRTLRPRVVASLAVGTLLLTSCGALDWVKHRFVEPSEPAAAAPAPATPPPPPPPPPPAPPPPQPAAEVMPAPQPEPAPAPRQLVELAPPIPTPAPPPKMSASPAAAAPVAAAPAAAAGDLARGRWAVEVGEFFVASVAESIRARVAQQLAAAGVAAQDSVTRVIKRGNRFAVAIGDVADRAAATALAQRLRPVLRQDLVPFQR